MAARRKPPRGTRAPSPALDLTLNAAIAEWSAAQIELHEANKRARTAAKARLELVIKVAKLEARIRLLDELREGLTK